MLSFWITAYVHR